MVGSSLFGSRSLQGLLTGCLASRTTLDPIKVYFKIACFIRNVYFFLGRNHFKKINLHCILQIRLGSSGFCWDVNL